MGYGCVLILVRKLMPCFRLHPLLLPFQKGFCKEAWKKMGKYKEVVFA
jgi:hypothetical protein